MMVLFFLSSSPYQSIKNQNIMVRWTQNDFVLLKMVNVLVLTQLTHMMDVYSGVNWIWLFFANQKHFNQPFFIKQSTTGFNSQIKIIIHWLIGNVLPHKFGLYVFPHSSPYMDKMLYWCVAVYNECALNCYNNKEENGVAFMRHCIFIRFPTSIFGIFSIFFLFWYR